MYSSFDSKSVLYGLTASLLVFVALFITFVTLYAKLKETCAASGSSNFANPSKIVNADNIVSNIAIQPLIASLPLAPQTNVTLSTNNSCTNFSLEGTFQPSYLHLQEMQMQNSSTSSLQVSAQQPLFVSTNVAEYTFLQKEDDVFLFKGSFTNDTVLSLASELKQSVTACLTHV